MSCVTLTQEKWETLETTSGTQAVCWFSGWIMCMGLDAFRAVAKLKGVVGSFEGQQYYQVATVRTNDPGQPTAIANTVFTNPENKYDITGFGTTTGPVFFIRFGIGYRLTAGTFARADASLQISYSACGSTVGAVTLQMQNSIGSGGKTIYPITDFFPAFGASKVKVAIIISGVDGAAFNAALVYQLADTSKEAPSGWVLTNIWQAGPTTSWTGATEACMGECTPQASITAMWMRLGLQVWSGTAGTLSQATVSAISAVRK